MTTMITIDAVTVPMLMHLGEEDEFISKDAQRRIKEAFTGNSHVEIHSYPGRSHAFARHTGVHYDPATDSERATLGVLCEAFAVIDGKGPGQCRSAGVHQVAFDSGLQAGFL